METRERERERERRVDCCVARTLNLCSEIDYSMYKYFAVNLSVVFWCARLKGAQFRVLYKVQLRLSPATGDGSVFPAPSRANTAGEGRTRARDQAYGYVRRWCVAMPCPAPRPPRNSKKGQRLPRSVTYSGGVVRKAPSLARGYG